MSKSIIIVILAACLLCSAAFAQKTGFGLGIIIGEPTGITGKCWLSGKSAIDGAVAWSFDGENLHLHADYLIHKFDLIKVAKGSLPLYFGVGVRVRFDEDDHHFDDHDHDNHHHHDRIGVRIPVGLDYLFAHDPVDIFFEIVPILDLTPDTEFGFNAAIGFRYFF
jgi:hypothetical protein